MVSVDSVHTHSHNCYSIRQSVNGWNHHNVLQIDDVHDRESAPYWDSAHDADYVHPHTPPRGPRTVLHTQNEHGVLVPDGQIDVDCGYVHRQSAAPDDGGKETVHPMV